MIDFFSRLDNFMKYKDLNDNKITVKAGISNGIIGKARKRGALSQENISKLLFAYPELNANWLLAGRGVMIYDPSGGSGGSHTQVESCQLCAEKDRTISVLMESNDYLKDRIKNLEKKFSQSA